MSRKQLFSTKVISQVSLPDNQHVTYRTEGTQWYPPIQISPTMIGNLAKSVSLLREAAAILDKLEQDDYSKFLSGYYRSGFEKFGEHWVYADIVTVILASAKLVKPTSYLEIGVRRGRSMAMVAASNPDCSILGADIWVENYANMSNPGPDFVNNEMKKIGYHSQVEFLNGDSHATIPVYLHEHPEVFFDMITVDGDHSEKGAILDIMTVIPRLKIGGVIIFDGIVHPSHPYLANVWKKCIKTDKRFSTWEFTELGYGVAAGIKASE